MKNFKDYGSENLNNSILSAYKERRNKAYLLKKTYEKANTNKHLTK